jgi:Coenzyme PQQ synthesis protein D (PqqD)
MRTKGLPKARAENLVVRELPEETLVYDVRSHEAHCLNRTAALVWKCCDGKTPVAAMAARVASELGVARDEALVRSALAQLGGTGLLSGGWRRRSAPSTGRRRALQRLGWGMAAPAVASILAPTLAEAVTCVTMADCGNLAKCFQSAASKCCDRRPCCEVPSAKCLPKGMTAQECGCA